MAQAGRKGAVTVATNMAGRGTDIMLGAMPNLLPLPNLPSAALIQRKTPKSTRPRGRRHLPQPNRQSRTSMKKFWTLADFTCLEPSATNPAGSTTSCVDVPDGKVTPPANPGSTSR